MTLNNYGTIAEIFSAFAILFTLAYGILQLRINNRLARVELTNQTSLALHDFYFALGRDAHAARIWRDGLAGLDNLSPDERTQFTLLCTSGLIGSESQFLLQKEGFMSPDFFDRSDKQVQFMMSQPGLQSWWPRHRMNFDAGFAERLDMYFTAAKENVVEAPADEAAMPQTSP